MFHLMHGYIHRHADRCYLDNALFGIEITYTGIRDEGSFFIAPLTDQQGQSLKYYAFDTIEQKIRFEELLKIQGVGGKSAYQLAVLPREEVTHALETMDLRYFQQLPGIGPKTAKRLLVELKQHFSADDLHKLSWDQKLFDDIITSLKGFGYAVNDIKRLIQDQPYPFTRDELPNIMKRLIDHL
jgi:Holliday junction resolvasome RuvABC DNA-binding subunit